MTPESSPCYGEQVAINLRNHVNNLSTALTEGRNADTERTNLSKFLGTVVGERFIDATTVEFACIECVDQALISFDTAITELQRPLGCPKGSTLSILSE